MEERSVQSLSLKSFIQCGALLVVVCLVIAFFDSGKLGIEKTLTAMAMPVGLLWLSIGSAFGSALLRRRKVAWMLGVIFLGFSLVSCQPFIDQLVGITEESVAEFVPAEGSEGLDVVVVLGGGTRTGPNRAEVSFAGDRVVYAAELFHQGVAKHLITTGESYSKRGQKDRIGPANETVEIWKNLRIPEEAITHLAGRTTYEEMIELRGWLEDQPDRERLRMGLLTSALHLPRALRLAEARGITDLIPLAADHRSNPRGFMAIDYFPRASALSQFADLQKEWMARLVAR